MSANQDVPPWMGSNPPSPPPGPAWPGPPPPPRSGSPGLLTFVGILNLLFSVCCGCVSGMWAAGWAALQEDPAAIVEQIDAQKEHIRTSIRKELDKDPAWNEEQNARIRMVTEQVIDPETMKDLVMAAGDNSATPAIRTATMVAGLSQAGLLIGSILLLMRKNAGRVLTMLALFAFIGATVATIVKFPPVADAVGTTMSSKIADSTGYKDLPQAEQRQVSQGLDHLPQILQGVVMTMSVIALVWPAISLLVVLFSRGIKDACAPAYRSP